MPFVRVRIIGVTEHFWYICLLGWFASVTNGNSHMLYVSTVNVFSRTVDDMEERLCTERDLDEETVSGR